MTTPVLGSCELRANAHVIKPVDAAKFADAIKQTDEFFLILMRQPQHAPRLPDGSGTRI
jgi:hypothetical protein